MITDEVEGDAVEPGLDGAVAAKGGAGVPGFEEAVLDDGFGGSGYVYPECV